MRVKFLVLLLFLFFSCVNNNEDFLPDLIQNRDNQLQEASTDKPTPTEPQIQYGVFGDLCGATT